MQRGGHGCSVEGTWVGRTREPAGPDVDLVRTETTKIKSLRVFCCYFFRLGMALSNVRTHARTYVHTYVRTYVRTQPRPKSAALFRPRPDRKVRCYFDLAPTEKCGAISTWPRPKSAALFQPRPDRKVRRYFDLAPAEKCARYFDLATYVRSRRRSCCGEAAWGGPGVAGVSEVSLFRMLDLWTLGLLVFWIVGCLCFSIL